MSSFPLRYQIAMALVGLNVVATAALTTFAYRESRDTLERQAVNTVGVAAHEREQALLRLLQERHDRIEAFLGSLESLCGEAGPRGGFGFEPECVRVAVRGFQTAEHATAADLRYDTRQLVGRGSPFETAANRMPGQLATISANGGRGDYVMQGDRGRLSLRVRWPLDDIDAIFQNHSGLGANDEILLTDREGHALTSVRNPAYSQAPMDEALQACRSGAARPIQIDRHDTAVMRGTSPVPAIGGGCVVANLQYGDVLIPIRALGNRVVLRASVFILVGAVVSLIVASATTRPIARLADSAHELEGGQFDQPVPIGGPTEVRQLGRALSAMSQAVGDLLTREHRARLDAEQANRTKDEFLAMLSHELRSPLTAILGWSTALLNRPATDRLSLQGLEAIERSARTQTRLVDELLDVSRIVSGTLRLNAVSDLSIGTLVETAIQGISPLADANKIEIVERIEAGSHTVRGDAGRLQQVIGNLLSNAMKFTPEGGRIDVAVANVDDTVEIRVSDTGIGIPPGFLPHVFERFRQADSSTTRSYGGLGLGLAIVKHVVELHGGTVRAESAGEGRGALFVASLPRQATSGDAAGAPPVGPRPTPPMLEGIRILVVDDDPDTRDVVRAILEGAGATVETRASAVETRAFLAHAQTDVLIADVGMPQEDGYALIRSLSPWQTGHIPAIALTAHARPEDVEEALASGFQVHVAKPVDSSELLSAVASTLIRGFRWSAAR